MSDLGRNAMPPKKRGTYTVEEVAEHNTAKSLWVIMNRKVYDITVFHKRHPGGSAVLLQMGGKDATAAAAAAHKSILPGNLMFEFCIGNIVRTKRVEVIVPETGNTADKAPGEPASAEVAPLPKASDASDVAPASPEGAKAAPKRVSAPGIKAKAKAKAKLAAQAKQDEAIDVEVCSHQTKSSGSRSAQGSLDEEWDCPARIHSADEVFDETDLNVAAEALRDSMVSDPRLERWVKNSHEAELLFEVRRFLVVALEGSDWTRNRKSALSTKFPKSALSEVKEFKSRIERCSDDLAGTLVDFLKKPFPLGEDALIAGLGALSRDFPNDQRLLQALDCLRGSSDKPTRQASGKFDGGANDLEQHSDTQLTIRSQAVADDLTQRPVSTCEREREDAVERDVAWAALCSCRALRAQALSSF